MSFLLNQINETKNYLDMKAYLSKNNECKETIFQKYLQDEHYFAILSPLVAPLILPMILGLKEEIARLYLGPQITLSLYSSLMEIKKMVDYARNMFNKRLMNAAQVEADVAAQRRERELLEEQIRLDEEQHQVRLEQGRQRHQMRLAEARGSGRGHRQRDIFTPSENLRVGGYGGLLGATGYTPSATDWSYTEDEEANTSRTLPLPNIDNLDGDVIFGVSSPSSLVNAETPVSRQVMSDTSLLGSVLLHHRSAPAVPRMSIGDEIQQAERAESASNTGDNTHTLTAGNLSSTLVTVTDTTASSTRRPAVLCNNDKSQNEGTDSTAAGTIVEADSLLNDGQTFGGQVWGAEARQTIESSVANSQQPPGELSSFM